MHSLSLTKQSNHLEKSPSSHGSTNRTLDENITVRFELNEFDTVAQVHPELTTVGEVLEDVAAKLQLLPKYLSIKQKFGSKIPKTARLMQLCTNNFRIFDVKLDLSDLAKHINESIRNDHEKIRLDTTFYYRQNLLPDFISVTISDKDDPENPKSVIVEIINNPIIKPFLGGFVNKITGLVYHNAFTQTGPLKEQIKFNGFVTRDTQTKGLELISTKSSTSHQEQKTDVTLELENRSAIMIQRNFRSFLFRRLIHNLSIDRKSQIEKTNELDEQHCIVKSPDTVNIGSPRTRADFKLIESKIQKWKENKIRYIKKRFGDKTMQQTEFHKLLEDEVRLLNEIDKKRNKIRRDAHEVHMEQMLDKMGAPIKWIGYKNIQCEMDSLQCQRIRKLTTLYRQLKTPSTQIERIEFVGELHTVLAEEPHSILLEELLDLLRREQKMLMVNIDMETILTLRRRQNELFRNFIASQKVFRPPAKSSV